VASQIAIALTLLVGTLLFARSLRNLRTLDAGFDPHGVLFADVTLSNGNAAETRKELLNRVRAIPTVQGAAEVGIVPLTGENWNNRMWMDDSDGDHARVAMRNMVGPDYFHTLKTPLVAGRDFEERDLTGTARVAVVNEQFARLFAGGSDLVGRRVGIEPTPYEAQTALEIIGVVKDTKYRDLREEFQPTLFVPQSQGLLKSSRMRMMIRCNASPAALIPAVRKTIAAISPGAQYSFRVFDTWVEESLLRERLMATLSTIFGMLALLLTAVGVYGVTAYSLTMRRMEIGIRIALGADRNAVMGLILREAALVASVGLAVGTAVALGLGRSAEALLFGMQANDPVTILAAAAVLLAITLLASGLPAWRAFRVDPASELRQN
jgi:predicted permease